MTDLTRYQQPTAPGDTGWVFEFPNGHRASIINDPRTPFRFEVLSDDPDDVGAGRVAINLTTEQVEAKLQRIANLPTFR